MARSTPSKGRKPIVIGIAVVLVVAGGVFAWGKLAGEKTEADRLLAQVQEAPEEQRFEQMRKIHDQARELSEEDRRQLRRGMRDMFTEEISRRIDEYENAPEDQKQAILDRQIDEMVERMNEWRAEREKRRAEREAAGEGEGDGRRVDGEERSEGGREGRGGRGGWGGRSVQDRKERMEGGNPDERARMIRHFMRMRQRATERGIDMGRGPGGGRGGRGH